MYRGKLMGGIRGCKFSILPFVAKIRLADLALFL
jgi:hypothetical protein